MEKIVKTNKGQFKIVTARGEDKIWFHLNGKTHCIDARSKQKIRRSGSSNDEHNGVILAPMPGKITKILTQIDSELKKGQVILVMEAMKMEYTIKAPFDGLISTIEVEVNQQVKLGQTLAQLKKGPS